MEHKKYTHVCVLKYALYVYPAKSRARTRVYLTPARHLGPAGFSAVKLIGSLLFVGTLPEAHHAAHGRHAWSTFRERPGRRTHTHRDVRSSQDSATRMATRERSRKVTESYRQHSQVILRPQTRVQTCYCSRSYTHKVRLRRPWNGDWRSFFVLKSVDSLPLEARWSWQLPTGAESPLPTVTAGWLRCPPAEPQRRGLSDYSPIHTPIFSSPPVLAHAYCRTPNALLGTPNPLLLWRHTQNFMQ